MKKDKLVKKKIKLAVDKETFELIMNERMKDKQLTDIYKELLEKALLRMVNKNE